VFTARYALSPYIKQIRFVFKGLINAVSMYVKSFEMLVKQLGGKFKETSFLPVGKLCACPAVDI
jgi:hypothetical protein